MSEKTAKRERKEQQGKPKHRMTIEEIDLGNGQGRINVDGIPNNLSVALSLLHEATKIIVGVYMEAAAKGSATKQEPSRIVPATLIPRFKQ